MCALPAGKGGPLAARAQSRWACSPGSLPAHSSVHGALWSLPLLTLPYLLRHWNLPLILLWVYTVYLITHSHTLGKISWKQFQWDVPHPLQPTPLCTSVVSSLVLLASGFPLEKEALIREHSTRSGWKFFLQGSCTANTENGSFQSLSVVWRAALTSH